MIRKLKQTAKSCSPTFYEALWKAKSAIVNKWLSCRRKSKNLRKVRNDINEYEALNDSGKFQINKENMHIALADMDQNAGAINEHYFLQDIWMASMIREACPQKHYDVGSSINGFIAHLLSFRKDVTLIDIRPFPHQVDGLDFICSNATEMNGIADESIESLSSLHAIEHFGLGRYGDPIDPNAWQTVLKSFQRVIKTGGVLYLSVPVGNEEKLCFNAHRIFAPRSIIEQLDKMRLTRFAIIHDMQICDIDIEDANNFIPEGGHDCGLFIFVKD